MSQDLLVSGVKATLSSLGWDYAVLSANEVQVTFSGTLWRTGGRLKVNVSIEGIVKAENVGFFDRDWDRNWVNIFLRHFNKTHAKIIYQASLKELKDDPTNADVREKTLEFGRFYSNITRDQTGVTIFDEIALMNDINAACAGGFTGQNPTNQTATQTIEERLIILDQLRAKNLIDVQEYKTRREKILNEI